MKLPFYCFSKHQFFNILPPACLQTRNAAIILNRTPFHVDAAVDGDQDFHQ